MNKTPSQIALITFGLLLAVCRCESADIIWGPATNISNDSDVITYGILHGSANFGFTGTTTTTVNGVEFKATSVSFASLASNSLGASSAPFSNLSPEYQQLLSTGFISGLSVGFSHLTIGHIYAMQVWSSSTLAPSTSITEAAIVLVSPNTGNSVSLYSNPTGQSAGLGQYAVGTFTADSTEHFFGIGGAGIVNALQLRDVTTVIPEPSTTAALIGLTVLSVVAVRRKR